VYLNGFPRNELLNDRVLLCCSRCPQLGHFLKYRCSLF
jgi:hypothetical protein